MGFYKKILRSPTRLAIAKFLNTEFLSKGIWFFNVWSIIHFIAGGLLMGILNITGVCPEMRWLVLLTIIIAWELFELVMSATTRLFVFEAPKDIMWDIILAIAAAGIVELIFLII